MFYHVKTNELVSMWYEHCPWRLCYCATGCVIANGSGYVRWLFFIVTDLQKAKTRRHYISYPLIGGLIGTLTALVALLTASLMCYRKRHRTQYAKSVTMSEIRRLHSSLKKASDRFGSLGEISPSYTSLEMLVNALGIKIYSNQSLTFDKELGEGAFGKV